MNVQEFKDRLNPTWYYNIQDKEGDFVFLGIHPETKERKPLTRFMFDQLIEEIDVDRLYIQVFKPNGIRSGEQRFSPKDNLEVTLNNTSEAEDVPESTPSEATQQAAPIVQNLPGLAGVFTNPQSGAFFYETIKAEKEKLERRVETLEGEIKAEKEKIRVFELKEIEHKNELRDKDREIKDLEDDLKDAKGWGDKLGGLLELAKTNPEGTQALVTAGLAGFKNTFGAAGQMQLNGPNSPMVSNIIQWFGQAPKEAQQLMYNVFAKLTNSPNFESEARTIIEMISTPNQAAG